MAPLGGARPTARGMHAASLHLQMVRKTQKGVVGDSSRRNAPARLATMADRCSRTVRACRWLLARTCASRVRAGVQIRGEG